MHTAHATDGFSSAMRMSRISNTSGTSFYFELVLLVTLIKASET